MAPSVSLMALATPPFCGAETNEEGHSTVLAAASFQPSGSAALRYLVKVSVVPELSARRTTLMSPAGSETPGLSALMGSASHLVISAWKILDSVGADSCSLGSPLTLYETVMGAATVGKYRKAPPFILAFSSSFTVLSVPANCTFWSASSCSPVPEPLAS